MANEKSRQREEQQALARERKKSKKKGAAARHETRSRDVGPIKNWTFVLREGASRYEAYKALIKSATLYTYVRRFRYHDPRQRATGRGEFTVELPFKLANQIQTELQPHWKFAKLALQAEETTND